MYISLTRGTWILYFAGRASCRPRCYGCPDPLTRVGCCSRLPQSPCQRHTFSQSFSVSPLATQCASVCESARISERKRESRSQPDIVDKRKYLEGHMPKEKGVFLSNPGYPTHQITGKILPTSREEVILSLGCPPPLLLPSTDQSSSNMD